MRSDVNNVVLGKGGVVAEGGDAGVVVEMVEVVGGGEVVAGIMEPIRETE